jgi:hypothetical protein
MHSAPEYSRRRERQTAAADGIPSNKLERQQSILGVLWPQGKPPKFIPDWNVGGVKGSGALWLRIETF